MTEIKTFLEWYADAELPVDKEIAAQIWTEAQNNYPYPISQNAINDMLKFELEERYSAELAVKINNELWDSINSLVDKELPP